MSEQFLGEIRIFSFGYAPRGWAFANGQLLAIAQNQALFSLFGTMYGGNGTVNFALPDLRGRVAAGVSNSWSQGQSMGQAGVTLISVNMPTHTHTLAARSDKANVASPVGAVPAVDSSGLTAEYSTGAPTGAMGASAVSTVGGNQAHPNQMPSTVVSFCVALVGIFPSRN